MSHLHRAVAASLLLAANSIAAPPNDFFADRIPLFGTNVTTSGSLLGATVEPGELIPASRSVWWTWAAPAHGTLLLSAAQSDFFDAVIQVYVGDSVSALTFASFGAGDNFTRLSVTVGTTYQIAVADYGTGAANIILTLQFFPPLAPE